MQKSLKSLCRLGVPPQFRSDVWRRLVYAQVKDIRASKGAHYYNHLVNCIHDSEVSDVNIAGVFVTRGG